MYYFSIIVCWSVYIIVAVPAFMVESLCLTWNYQWFWFHVSPLLVDQWQILGGAPGVHPLFKCPNKNILAIKMTPASVVWQAMHTPLCSACRSLKLKFINLNSIVRLFRHSEIAPGSNRNSLYNFVIDLFFLKLKFFIRHNLFLFWTDRPIFSKEKKSEP